MNVEKAIEKSEHVVRKMEVLRSRRNWLPRMFRNWFRNSDGIDALSAELASRHNRLLKELSQQTGDDRVGGMADRFGAENTALLAEIQKCRSMIDELQSREAGRDEATPPHEMYYFMHIPKTAGFSVETYLKDVFKPEDVVPLYFPRQLAETPQNELRRYKLVIGHMFGLPDPILGLKTRKATFLRNPFDRAVSAILHGQRYEQNSAYESLKNLSVSEVLQSPRFASSHFNYQARHIATLAFSVFSLTSRTPEGLQHPYPVMERLYYELFSGQHLFEVAAELLDQFDFVGLTEHMDMSLKGLAEAWRLPYPKAEYSLNRNPEKTDYRALVSDEVYEKFRAQNEADFKLYDLVKRRLVDRHPHPLFTVA